MRLSRAGVWLWAVVVWLVTSSTASTSSPEARQIFKALNAVRVDRAQVYYVRDLHLRKDAIRLSFVEGKLALLEATEGRVTGAVFTGTGRVIAVPRDPVERRSLAWFLGTPLLDQPFTRAYLRFTDGTAAQVLAQIRAANGQPIESAPADSFAEDWNPTVANLNSWHSLRILLDWLSSEPRPYLYAGLAGASVGPFDVLVDDRREEQVMIGQSRLGKGGHDYDIWASFPSAAGGTSPRANASENYLPSFSAISYSVSTTIRPEMILEGQTKVRMRARRDGERVATMELSRFLSVRGVVDGRGRSLEFFQNETLETQAIAEHGSDDLYVVLQEASREGEEIQLSITYQGRVISDAGNDIYLVGERGGWYPSLGGRSPETSGFAVFDLTFRWPRRLTLAATGKRGEIREEGEWRIGRWQTEMPVPKAGFHLGEYVTHPVNNENFNVEVYTTRQLAEALHMGEEVADSIRFYEKYHGSFPFSTLAVSPIPGVASPETP